MTIIKKLLSALLILLLLIVALQQTLSIRTASIFRSHDRVVTKQLAQHDYESAYYELNHTFNQLAAGKMGTQDWHTRKQARLLRKKMNLRVDALLPKLDSAFPRGIAGDWRSTEELKTRYDLFITWFTFRITREDKTTESVRNLMLQARGLTEIPILPDLPERTNTEATKLAKSYPIEIDNNSDQPLRVVINGDDQGTISPNQVITVDVPVRVPNIATATFFIANKSIGYLEFKPGRDTLINPQGKNPYVVVSQSYYTKNARLILKPNGAQVSEIIKGESVLQARLGLCSSFPKTIPNHGPSQTRDKLYRQLPKKPSVNEALRILSTPHYYFFEGENFKGGATQKKLVQIVKSNASRPEVQARIIKEIEEGAVLPLFFECLSGREKTLSEPMLTSWLLGSNGESAATAAFATTAFIKRGQQSHLLNLLEHCPVERWEIILATLNKKGICKHVSPDLRGAIVELAMKCNIELELTAPLLEIFWEESTVSMKLIKALEDFQFKMKWDAEPPVLQSIRIDWANRIQAVTIKNLSTLPVSFAQKTALSYLDTPLSKRHEKACAEFLIQTGASNQVLHRYAQFHNTTRHAIILFYWDKYQRTQIFHQDTLAAFEAGLADAESDIRYSTFLFLEAIYYKIKNAVALQRMEAAVLTEKDSSTTARMAHHVKAIGGKVPASILENPEIVSCTATELKALRGKSKAAVIQAFGRPKEFLRLGEKTIILYPFAQIELKNNKVIATDLTR